MSGAKVAVYGLSTEGYSIACQMAIKGADVFIIDESTPSAISLKPEIAKTYPNVSSLKEDEPLLAMVPIDVAISKSQYLFFTPKIRKIGQDTKTEICSKFKDATSNLKKGSSVIYNIATGFGGNNENISLLEHITGFEVGKSIHYYYYPLSNHDKHPDVIGSFNNKIDKKLTELLSEKKQKRFVGIPSSEYFHAINILSHFSSLCSILEVCKFAQDVMTKDDLSSNNFKNIFLDDIVNELHDLRVLGSSFEGTSTLMYLINGSIKGIDGYTKRLIDEIRAGLKKNELKASKTKIALSWTLDQYEIRGDKIETLRTLISKLKDYIGDVEAYEDVNFDLFHSDKNTLIITCSKTDFENIEKNKKDANLIIMKANSLCEIVQKT
jgi:hypothetical protein